jgi:hypothetical protein
MNAISFTRGEKDFCAWNQLGLNALCHFDLFFSLQKNFGSQTRCLIRNSACLSSDVDGRESAGEVRRLYRLLNSPLPKLKNSLIRSQINSEPVIVQAYGNGCSTESRICVHVRSLWSKLSKLGFGTSVSFKLESIGVSSQNFRRRGENNCSRFCCPFTKVYSRVLARARFAKMKVLKRGLTSIVLTSRFENNFTKESKPKKFSDDSGHL